MTTNPYQSPASDSGVVESSSENRRSALWSIRWGTLLLVAAGLFNHAAFDSHVLVSDVPPIMVPTYRAVNLIGIGLLSVFSWVFLLPCLEVFGRVVRRIVGWQVEPRTWDNALYRSLKPAALLAIPGAALWCIWVVGFYYLQLNFMLLSIAVGIPAHLLAAGLYVPLIYRWFVLARGSHLDPQQNTIN